MKQRIIWIDYIKAIAITIVIMLHIGVPNPFKTVTRSFIIPLFFILSGLFGSPQKYVSYKEFWKQKTLRLLIPYFIFNVITYIYLVVYSKALRGRCECCNPHLEAINWYFPWFGALDGTL